MELEEIVNKAIPIKPKDCRLIIKEKTYQRQVLTERIINYVKEKTAPR